MDNPADNVYASPDGATLSDLSAAYRDTLKRRLVLWAARWAIGFALIAVAVSSRPAWAWLWWAGVTVAAFSLLVTLSMHVLMAWRLRGAKTRIAEYERLAQAAEEESVPGGDRS